MLFGQPLVKHPLQERNEAEDHQRHKHQGDDEGAVDAGAVADLQRDLRLGATTAGCQTLAERFRAKASVTNFTGLKKVFK